MKTRLLILLGYFILCCGISYGQSGQVLVNLAALDGIPITPSNILQYQIQSGLERSSNTKVNGTIKFRNSDMRISYSYTMTLHPGVNIINANTVNARFTYSSTALKELFELYGILPQGIYEYCVQVLPDYNNGEGDNLRFDECLYNKSEDLFLINLIMPEDDAKIYEYNPLLTWIANYPFASLLQYRIRVVELREGQNKEGAITRNNPVYDEKNLMQNSIVYPVYAKPLRVWQPYVWTVDAYYKGILLGGAAPWKFTVVEDSLLTGISKDPSYVDIAKETGTYQLYAPGILKLKYDLKWALTDTLALQLLNEKGEDVKLKITKELAAKYGDNRYILNFMEEQPLKHKHNYTLLLHSREGKKYNILFQYINPELIK